MGHLALELQAICKKAGVILESYRSGSSLNVQKKKDGSPVTDADKEASDFIVHELRAIAGRLPIISEENWNKDQILHSDKADYWIVDPLDGTKDFIEGKDDYTINMAWLKKHELHVGCIYHPPTERFYFAQKNAGAFCQVGSGELNRISAKLWPDDNPHVLLSRSHATFENDLVKKVWPKAQVTGMASALKFCKLAEGYADLYFRDGPTMEWDTAAGQLIVEEAGGLVIDWQCQKLDYHKPERMNPGFIAIANRAFISDIYDVLVKNRPI